MMNNQNAKPKKSDVELKTDLYIIVAVGIQFILCIVGAIFAESYWHMVGCKLQYMNLNENDPVNCENWFLGGVIAFGSWFLMLMNFVPISLMVTLEMVKFLQGMYIAWDFKMFDLEKGQ
jgi:phospholipid-transporting ATPase